MTFTRLARWVAVILCGISASLILPKDARADAEQWMEQPKVGARNYIDSTARLDLDGIRRSGLQGAVDLSGYSATIDPRDGSIRLAQDGAGGLRAEGDENWWDGFGSPGVSDRVNAMAVYDGALIVTGEFEFASGLRVNRIARWDGTSWSSLGEGINGTGRCLHVHDEKLIVGGYFNRAGGNEARYIAQWDGVSWSAVGSGFNWAVFALTTYDGDLIAGGEFVDAGGVTVNRIARWDGSGWLPFGSGANDIVTALGQYGGDLIVGGWFDQIDGLPISRVARWNGSVWSPMGSWQLWGPPQGFAEYQGQLHAACWDHVVRWSGTSWVDLNSPALGAGIGLRVFDGKLVHCGWGGSRIYAWDGVSWTPLGLGLGHYEGIALGELDGKLYAGGFFFSAGDENVLHIAAWDGSAWDGLGGPQGQGIGGRVRALAQWRGDLIAGGYFSVAGGAPVNNIARWDGASWHPLGEGVTGWSGEVDALLVYQDQLIAAGDFEYAGGMRSPHIARWDGTSWGSIGGGTDCGRIRALAEYQGDLIAVGEICKWGDPTAWRILRWDGFSWSGVGTWPETCEVWAVAVWNDMLVVGGCFRIDQGAPADYIAAWDGSNWNLVGNQINGDVKALASYNGSLIAGGYFNVGNGGDGMARWDGISWGPVGGSSGCATLALAVVDGDLYAAGETCVAGGQQVSGVARYDGYGWSPLGSGLTRRVYAMAPGEDPFGAYLYLGGEISWAGDGLPSGGIARWRLGETSRPILRAVTDIGNDQGRQVRLRWSRSKYDAPGQPVAITGYAVFREQGEFAGPAVETNPGEPGLRLDGWDYIATVPAFGDSSYQCVAPTLCDSTIVDGLCLSTFLVRAMTANPLTYYDSAPLSGYSVDNLAPAVPRNLRLEQPQRLVWDESLDADFDYFTVYGSANEELDETAVALGHTTENSFDLPGFQHAYFHVTGTDFSGNEGEAATLSNPAGVDDAAAAPASVALELLGSNPMKQGAPMRFGLPGGAHARLEIFDASGRLVVRLLDGEYPAGWHAAGWNGRAADERAVPPGIYFARLTAGGKTRDLRFVIVR